MVPERFGRYQVLEQIGDGAMGRVYRARDPVVGRVVAIKTIKSEYLSRGEAPEYLRRFRREAQAAGVLNHPGIVRIFDVGEDHIVMEHLEGQTLQALLKKRGRLPPAEAALMLAPVAAALDHAHRQGVVHRDIKPSNIMILPDGRPKLMDFGVAHFESSVMTSTGQILGSPSYMAPEQVAGRTVTSRTDVYALGVVAYEAVTGQRPFQGSNVTTVIYKIMSEPAPPPRSLNDTLPTRYDDIFRKALAKDPAERFATAAELVVALEIKEFEAALSAAIVPEAVSKSLRAESPTPPLTRRRGRAWMAAALAAAAALLAFLVARTPAPSTERQASAPTPSPFEGGPSLAGPSTTAAPPPVSSPEEVPPTPSPVPRVPARMAPATPPRAAAPSPPVPSSPPTATPAPAVTEGALVEMGPDVTPPRRISGETASYPEAARRMKQEGTVRLTFIVNANGEPTELQVLKSAGKHLDDATLAAARTWRFEPARKDGVAVSVRWVVEQSFARRR